MRGEVESRMVELTQSAEATTLSVLGEVTGEIKRGMEQTQAQTSHTVGSTFQQLEKEIEVAVSGATATSESITRWLWQRREMNSRHNLIRFVRNRSAGKKK